MTIELNLPSDLQSFVTNGARAIGSKPEDYVVLLLRNAQRREDQIALEAKLLEGIESLDQGEGKRITPDFWDGLRAQIRNRFGEDEQQWTLPVVRSARAELDMEEIANRLGEESPQLAFRFIRAVERTLTSLAERPHLGAPFETDNPRLQHCLVWPVKQFPKHLLFFRNTGSQLEIIRVIHGARDLEAI